MIKLTAKYLNYLLSRHKCVSFFAKLATQELTKVQYSYLVKHPDLMTMISR